MTDDKNIEELINSLKSHAQSVGHLNAALDNIVSNQSTYNSDAPPILDISTSPEAQLAFDNYKKMGFSKLEEKFHLTLSIANTFIRHTQPISFPLPSPLNEAATFFEAIVNQKNLPVAICESIHNLTDNEYNKTAESLKYLGLNSGIGTIPDTKEGMLARIAKAALNAKVELKPTTFSLPDVSNIPDNKIFGKPISKAEAKLHQTLFYAFIVVDNKQPGHFGQDGKLSNPIEKNHKVMESILNDKNYATVLLKSIRNLTDDEFKKGVDYAKTISSEAAPELKMPDTKQGMIMKIAKDALGAGIFVNPIAGQNVTVKSVAVKITGALTTLKNAALDLAAFVTPARFR